ncbi:MAG: Gfo/Idh/MocA family oxidoreductase [Armatimonadota bacterium]|nr:Gfo/Idh/MocA family oxidoreductase [Armatimonadota bacterium]
MGISLGIVGLGSFGSQFAGLFNAHPGVSRLALCDRETERVRKFADNPAFAGKLHARDVYESLDAICASDVEALALFTQPWLHAPQAIRAMEAGKHVYSAVPIISLPDGQEILDWCDKLVETCRRTGQSYMLGETTYYRASAMFCRRKAAAGAFGSFVHAEGEYCHDYVSPSCSLKEVRRHRLASQAGQEWLRLEAAYRERGIQGGPMHYPTHSTSGPISVMQAHAVKVAAFGYCHQAGDEFFEGEAFSNETALFQMSNGATMRICEHREIGRADVETFRVFGTQAGYSDGYWMDKAGAYPLQEDEMRDPLPDEVRAAFGLHRGAGVYGGHGGSHPYLVHEFVDALNQQSRPAISVWEAVRYMAAGVMAHQSALREGELLSVPDWGDAPRE